MNEDVMDIRPGVDICQVTMQENLRVRKSERWLSLYLLQLDTMK